MKARRLALFAGLFATLFVAGPAQAAQSVLQHDWQEQRPAGWDDGTTSNWSNSRRRPRQRTPTRRGSRADAFFEGTSGTVNVNGTINSVNSINFTQAGYSLSGGTINLTGPGGNITTNSGNATIGSTLTGTVGLTKLGNGMLTIAAPQNYTGATTVSAGTLRLYPGNTLLADNLLSTTLNSNNWTTVTKYPDGNSISWQSGVTPTSTGLYLGSRAYLNTAQQFDPAQTGGLVVTGNWSFVTTDAYAPYKGDLMQIVVNSSGQPDENNYGEATNGVEFHFPQNK